MRMILNLVLTAVCAFAAIASTPAAWASEQVFRSTDEFLASAFEPLSGSPDASVLWLSKPVREQITRATGFAPRLRVRYWLSGERSAWILDEIGKDKPITIGVVVDQDEIHAVDVLVFRESRGWEIKHPFFTRQFANARLNDHGRLNVPVDGITGATLSVQAMKRVARAALMLNAHRRQAESTYAKAR